MRKESGCSKKSILSKRCDGQLSTVCIFWDTNYVVGFLGNTLDSRSGHLLLAAQLASSL